MVAGGDIVKSLKANGETDYELEVYYTDELGSGGLNMDNPMFINLILHFIC